jgi:tRNA A-37 threonylcarbamoyl transferase component Bud32
VEKGYEVYCLADEVFYDSPTLVRRDDVDFALARGPVPAGYRRFQLDDWLVHQPEGLELPPQGWKIHASACQDNAEEILDVIWNYCVPRRIAFKFIRSPELLFLRNLKYAERGSSGKFVTIYPADEAALEVVLSELGRLLEGRQGPYILSDLRWGDGPLYVRYGGFAERYCVGPSGELELAIADASGQLVADRRGSTFQVPPWVTLPACLAPHLAARNGTTIQDLPYRFDRALHFSNGGGIYAGEDLRTQSKVVLKEARPHTALSIDGADAVTRLRHERDMLERLAGTGAVPALVDYFTLGEHDFLVEEFIEGQTLNSLIIQRWPLVAQQTDAEEAAAYASWALDTYALVDRAVAAVHDRGVVIGDLHPDNMLVRPDGSVVLIDLEVATLADDRRRPTLADPGFTPPRDRAGIDVDRHALACLRLYMFLPLTTLLVLDRGKAEHFADAITQVFPVPPEFVAAAVRTITGADARDVPAAPTTVEPDAAGWRAARDSLAGGILASATPDRDDRLFPGDVRQFFTGALNLAHGAAGVLYALHTTGAGRYPDHEDWLLQRATHPKHGTRVGLYDGLHGVAFTLDALGRRSDALSVLEICLDELDGREERIGLDLAGGLAGVALNLAHFAETTGDAGLWERAWRTADLVAGRLGSEDSVGEISGGPHPYAGLLRGSSGPALMFLRLYEHSRDPALLDLAAVALRQDLRRCVASTYGPLEVNEGRRTMPYVADGSVGIAFVLDDYLAHRADERFADAAMQIRGAAEGQFYGQTGLFYGRAGMIMYLSREHPPGEAGRDAVVATHVRRLGWHAMTYKGHMAFPGDQLLRLSMDLATGSAGVLLALGAALHDQPVHLPFLGPVGSRARADHEPLAAMEAA